ncbi:MAG: YigZ family protein [Eubacteriales bacterium]|nr:YigZ family protein [Eubacteriales bacterium]
MGIKIVYKGGEGEIIEKKSRFIATVKPVHSEEEAIAFINELKKKYWNATHNCSAFVIGSRQELQRCSDDGEPQGTAGRPMLEVLLGEKVHDVVVVVTRYFGGTLLGTGGLVRAYSKAVQEGLRCSTVIEKLLGSRLTVETDYNGVGKLQYLFGQKGIAIVDSEYTDVVKLSVLVEAELVDPLLEEITEATNGKAKYEREDDLYFAFVDKEPIIFQA